MQFLSEPGDLDPAKAAALTANLWADIAFDDDAHAALRRDGLDPDALRLTGPNPFSFALSPDNKALVVTAPGAEAGRDEALLDLFRIYFLRRILTGTDAP